MQKGYKKDLQYVKFCAYGFLKNLRFFDPFLILFFLEKGLGFLEIGILYSTREIVLMISEIPSGVISDTLGRRKTLIISFGVYILSFLVFYYSDSYMILIAAMILFAFGDAFRTGVHKAMIFNYLQVKGWGEYKVDYYGRTRSWSQTGSAVSAMISSVFVFFYGNYSIIFLVSIIPYLLDMILVMSYPKYLDGVKGNFSKILVKERFRVVFTATIQSVKKLRFISTLTNLSIYTAYYRIVKDYIQPVIQVFALSIPIMIYYSDDQKVATTTGLIYTILFMISAFASRNSGRMKQLFKNYRMAMNNTLIIGFVIGLSMALFFLMEIYIIVFLGFVIIVVIENLRKPVGIGLIADISDDKAMATTLSITSQAKSVLAAIIAPVLGYFADLYNPGAAIGIISLILLLLIPVYWLRPDRS